MGLITKKIVDYAEPLTNELHESFCSEYLRLDLEDKIANKRSRRIKAYRASFPETYGVSEGLINSRATQLLRNKHVADRLRYLYEEEGSSVENEYGWTRSKSEDVLVSIVYNEESKNGDILKAIQQLNTMRGIDTPIVRKDDSETDTVEDFFNNIVSGDTNA